jgi:hypothetical protein
LIKKTKKQKKQKQKQKQKKQFMKSDLKNTGSTVSEDKATFE